MHMTVSCVRWPNAIACRTFREGTKGRRGLPTCTQRTRNVYFIADVRTTSYEKVKENCDSYTLIVAFRVLTPCKSVGGYQHFERTCFPHLQAKIECEV
jgi:hypothetical protein